MSSLAPIESSFVLSQQKKERPRPHVALVAASLDIIGGQGVQARDLTDCLRREGYTVDFIPINPPFPARMERLRRYRYIRTVINEVLYLRRLFALRHAKVAHIFSASYWSFLLAPVPAMLLARLFGKRVVLHYHSGEADDHLANWGVLVHPWLLLVDELVVPSEYLQKVFANHGYPTRVIHNVIDLSQFRYRSRAPLRPRLLSVRNFDAHYCVDVTVRAFSQIKQRFPDATLTLAGGGADGVKLRQLAARIGGDAIRFVGQVAPQAMPALYEQCDIFLNASVIDNQPVSVLEAFAAGLPVVSTATGDIAAMVRNGQTGLIIEPDNPMAMADAVSQLLYHSEWAQRIAARARATVEHYTWASVRDEWASVYSIPQSDRYLSNS